MKTRWALVLMLLVGTLLVGCSSSSGSNSKGAADSGSAQQVTSHKYDVMKLDANAEKAKALMPALIESHIAGKIKNSAVAGTEYVDVRGVEPTFVGYEVVAWEAKGDADVEYVEVPYLNGHIAVGLASPETELSKAPSVSTYNKANVRPMPASPSEGEQAAVKAAREKLDKLFPDRKWTYGVKQYLFLYDKGGTGMVMGTTLEGKLGIYSQAVTLAK
ncbi:MAG: hypothetical protein HGA39_06090 [Coriobacteriia bacterium]|nr:hypothetical protein [Coriobacteriia bacterium]